MATRAARRPRPRPLAGAAARRRRGLAGSDSRSPRHPAAQLPGMAAAPQDRPRLRGGPAVPFRAVYVRLELLVGESELLVHRLDGDGQREAGGHWHAELQVNTAAAGVAERPGGRTGRVAAILGPLAELAGKNARTARPQPPSMSPACQPLRLTGTNAAWSPADGHGAGRADRGVNRAARVWGSSGASQVATRAGKRRRRPHAAAAAHAPHAVRMRNGVASWWP